jgi:hypothetical protein
MAAQAQPDFVPDTGLDAGCDRSWIANQFDWGGFDFATNHGRRM